MGNKQRVKNETSAIFTNSYGYKNNQAGELAIYEREAQTLQLIFKMCLDDNSVLGIIKELERNHPAIITKEDFNAVKEEKLRRSNIITTENGFKRKNTKYCSKI